MDTLYYYDKDTLLATIKYDLALQEVELLSYTTDIIRAPFGIAKEPTWKDFMHFLESRCVPRTRYNIKSILERWGLDVYDPLQLIRKTHGIQNSDSCWIRFEGEILDYAAIKELYSL